MRKLLGANALIITWMIFVVLASGTAHAIDVAPTISLSANALDVDSYVTLTAVAVDVLDNKGIQWIKLYENGTLIDSKNCGNVPTCTFVKVVEKSVYAKFSYYVTTMDKSGKTATSSTIVVAFTPNRAPVAISMSARTWAEDSDLQIDLSQYFSDLDGDTLTYSVLTDPTHISADIAGATVTLTPDADWYGTDSVKFRASDGHLTADGNLVSLIVTPVNDAPTTIGIPSQTIAEDSTATVDISSYFSDVDGDALTYSITAENVAQVDCSVTENNLEMTPAENWNGATSCTVTATDGSLTTESTVTITVTPVNDAPSVIIDSPSDEDSFVEGTVVTFSASGSDVDGDSLTYSWEFGDDNDATGVSVAHTYSQDGMYTVTVTATDADGLYGTDSLTIIITDTNPTAGFSFLPASPSEGESVSFTDESTAYDAPLTYGWDFGDAGSATVQNPTHTFAGDGVYTIILTVTDSDGSIDVSSQTITVSDTVPTVDAGVNATVDEGSFISFLATASGYDAPLSYHWDFGDGSATDDGNGISHAYSDAGVYTVTLTVTDSDGSYGTDTFTVTVNDVDPTADFVYSPTSPAEGTSITFTSISTGCDADVITSYVWDFGDGTIEVTTDTVIQYTYSDDGNYTVLLTVYDEDSFDSTTQLVSVANVAPVLGTIGNRNIGETGTLLIQMSATDVSGDTLTYSTDATFGTLDAAAGSFTWTTTYSDAGAYTVTFSVSDEDGGTDSETITINVLNINRAPVIAIDDQTTDEDTSSTVNLSAYASDADGETLTFIVTNENAAEADCSIAGDQLTITPAMDWNGIAHCTIEVSDSHATTASDEFAILVTPVNDAPYLITAIPDVSFEEDGTYLIDLSDYFADIDSALTYSAASNDTNVIVSIAGADATISTTAGWNGVSSIEFIASDGSANATDSIIVTVTSVPTYAVWILSNPYNQNVEVGQVASYIITIRNIGDTTDSYTLSVQNIDGADYALLNETSVSVDAGQDYNVELTVMDTNPGSYLVTVTADGNDDDTTSAILTNVTTTDTGWVYDSWIDGAFYVSQSTGIFDFINDSFVRDSNLTNVIMTDSSITSSSADGESAGMVLTNVSYTNAIVYNSGSTLKTLANEVLDCPVYGWCVIDPLTENNTYHITGPFSILLSDTLTKTGTVTNNYLEGGFRIIGNSFVNGSRIIRSNITDSDVFGSTLIDISVVNSVISNSDLSGLPVGSTLTEANVTDGILYSGTLTTADMLYNATGLAPLNLSDPYSWPAVVMSYLPSSIDTNTAVTFSAAVSGQLDNSTTLVYDWDFNGDGVTDSTGWNSSTVMKTYSSAGTYYARITVTDGHGNSARQTRGITVASVQSSGPSGGSSSSGGGGTTTLEPLSSGNLIHHVWIGLWPGNRYSMDIDNKNVAFTNIGFNVTEKLSRVELVVARLYNSTPAGLNNVYQYIQVNATPDGKMSDIEIAFKVNQSWIDENGLDAAKLQLALYRNGKWEYVSTSQVGDGNGFINYTSDTTGFGIFAITAPLFVPAVETTIPGNEITVVANQTANKTETPINPALLAGIVAVVVIIILAVIVSSFNIFAKKEAMRDGGEPLPPENFSNQF